VKRGANLLDPESVKEVIAQQDWSEGYKKNVVDAYQGVVVLKGLTWTLPFYKRVNKLPFIPTEKEIDQLISGVNYCISAFLQLLKETAIRPGEAWQLRWIDLNCENKTVNITPEKNSNPRLQKISNQLLSMLLAIPRKEELIFKERYKSLNNLGRTFQRQRKKVAEKLANQRVKAITFKTLRHWKATMEYHKTKDILHVKRLLGHKNINNTLIYTHLVNFESDEWVCKVAGTIAEAGKLVEAGFDFITQFEGKMLFRKRK